MKTQKQQIRIFILLILLALFANVDAQNGDINKGMFLRVYNLAGEKINKGKLLAVSDTLLQLLRNNKTVNVDVKSIGYIKTKRSAGNNILTGSLIGATTFGIFGAATAEPDAWILGYTAAEGAAGGVFLGGVAGAALGGITVAFKNSTTYQINGDLDRWKIFVEGINN